MCGPFRPRPRVPAGLQLLAAQVLFFFLVFILVVLKVVFLVILLVVVVLVVEVLVLVAREGRAGEIGAVARRQPPGTFFHIRPRANQQSTTEHQSILNHGTKERGGTHPAYPRVIGVRVAGLRQHAWPVARAPFQPPCPDKYPLGGRMYSLCS